MAPKISIIVPVYNAERRLPLCIDSILVQTFNDYELILVDDGSKDHSGEICDSYAANDCRVKVIHQPNGGVSAARNKGLQMAIGEFITFIDSDDTVLLDYLAAFSFDCDFCLQGYISSGVTSSICKLKPAFYEVSGSEQLLLRGFNTAPWSKLFRHYIIEEQRLSFPLDISYGEDAIFIFNYLLYCKTVRVLSTVSYNYYISETGLGTVRPSTINVYRMFNLMFSLLEHLLQDCKHKHTFMEQKVKSAIIELYERYDMDCMNLQDDSFMTYIHKYCSVEEYNLLSLSLPLFCLKQKHKNKLSSRIQKLKRILRIDS